MGVSGIVPDDPREVLLGRVVDRYRRLGFTVFQGRSRRFSAYVGLAKRWFTPDFRVESRKQGIVRLCFVEPGPDIEESRVERWALAARQHVVDVVVHCPFRLRGRIRRWCEDRGLDIVIQGEPAARRRGRRAKR